MEMMKSLLVVAVFALYISCTACSRESNEPDSSGHKRYSLQEFCMGADLSYVNQVEDHGGIFKDSSEQRDPFRIFSDHGCNLVRVRMWNNPTWTKTVYGDDGTQLYSDLADVEKTMKRAKEMNMGVNLDLHYSDTWADPDHQDVPAAWKDITSLEVLKDSVYNFTHRTLLYLSEKGLMPEMVQVGNEINCGMMKTNTIPGFPSLDACSGNWQALGEVINSAIQAVRDVSAGSTVKPQIILHIADPKNIEWWFDNIQSKGKVSNYDIIGISFYPLWHTGISFSELQGNIAQFRLKYYKKVMVVETGYPWTIDSNDGFTNLFGSQPALSGYPFTPEGQLDFMTELTQKVISAGGSGVIVWEPAWISSSLVTQWGTGSAWENVTFFDFDGNTLQGIDFMNREYDFPENIKW